MVKNNPNSSSWSLKNGYKIESNKDKYPMNSNDFGQRKGFNLILTIPEEDIEGVCNMFQGFTIILSVPGDEQKSREIIHLPLFEYVRVSIKPKLITTSDGLRNYWPNQRKCFYDSEQPLHFYKNYSQNNCEMECLAYHMENTCNCVTFSMPSKLN